MKRRLYASLVLLVLLLSLLFLWLSRSKPEGLFAQMHTSKGRVVFRLHYEEVPITVANFVALAEGTHPLVTGESKGVPFYDGLTFHNVIPGEMVQGGDPKGTGNGGPGFRFGREFRPALRHDRPGILSMLNEGPFAHGSQFFITLKAIPRYDDRHTVFGEAVEGLTLLGRLEEGDAILSVSILRRGKKACAFDLSDPLEKIARSAREAEALRRNQAKAALSLQTGPLLDLPPLTGRTDPAKVPDGSQPEAEKVALEYLLVSHRHAVPPMGSPLLTKPEARRRAEHLTALARQEGTDFVELARRFSDSLDYRIPLLARNSGAAAGLLPCFRLRTGQVSDPVDTPKGFMVFRRVELVLIEVRHILVAYQGAQASEQTRTQEEARDLAEQILGRARQGEDFSQLARKYSDSASAKEGGRIGEIARGMTVPAFDHAAFALEAGEISNVVSTPAGYQIIQRIR